MNDYTVDARLDPVARLWVATSDSVPGVAMEAVTCEKIIEVVKGVLADA